MFQCDAHYRCSACTAAVLKGYGLVVQFPPLRGGTVTTLGGRLQERGGGAVKRKAGADTSDSCDTQKPLTVPFEEAFGPQLAARSIPQHTRQ